MKINELLIQYNTISLAEMKNIRLMNRTDTKFVTSKTKLLELLALAREQYFVQEIDGLRIAEYYTVYFDTPRYDMFRVHHCGHTNRQKLRIRSYVDSKLSFLEVKTKNNHSRTKKKRMPMSGFDPDNPRYDVCFDGQDEGMAEYTLFLQEHLFYDAASLTECIENRFRRITLVNKGKTERLTIDMDVRFHNLVTDKVVMLDNVVIIELKRDRLLTSPILPLLRQLRIKRSGFSKYCIGTVFTNADIPQNRFKMRMRKIASIQQGLSATDNSGTDTY